MATAQIISADEVAKLVPAVVAQAQQIAIESAEDYEMACSFLTLIATRQKQVGETFDPIVKKAHAAWKEAIEQRAKFLDPLEEAEKNVKSKVAAWDEEQERLRQEQEAREQEAARAHQIDQAVEQAAQHEANGDKDLAALVLEEASHAPAPVVVIPSSVPKQEGISKTTNWKWRYKGGEDDALRLLVKAAATDERWLAYLCVNETAVGGDARTKKGLAKVPGIEFYPERGVSVRTKGR